MRKYLFAIALVAATTAPAFAVKSAPIDDIPSAATLSAASPLGVAARIPVLSPPEHGVDVRAGPADDRSQKVARYD
jgi:hypothetical protein